MERTKGSNRFDRQRSPAPSDVAVPDRVRALVSDAVANARPARSLLLGRTRARLVLASLLVPALAAAIAMTASKVVYGHPFAGLIMAVEHGPMLAAAVAASLVIACGASFIAISRGASGLGPSAIMLALVTFVVAPLYAALILPTPLHTHQMASWPGISAWGVRCFVVASLVAGGVLALFAGALRAAVPVAPRLRSAALGAAAGAWAGLAVLLFCPSGEQQHLLFGHVLPIIVATLGGTAVARVVRP